MSTTNTIPSEAMRRLIDSRLDAVDRALMGLLSRNDRLATVAQIETRIRELATADSADEASLREQQGRAKLDDLAPLGEGVGCGAALQPFASAASRVTSLGRFKRSRLALSSGILGIVALVLLFLSPIAYFVVANFGSNEVLQMSLLGTLVAAVAIGGAAAVVFGIVALVRLNRRADRLVGHGWAVTGLCTGPLPMLAGGLIALIAGMQSLAMESVSTAGVQPVVVSVDPMTAPAYAPVSRSASLPESYPPPSSFVPPPSAPAGYPSPSGGVDGFPTSRVPSDQPAFKEAPEVGLETR